MSARITFLEYLCGWFLGRPARHGPRHGESWWRCPLHAEDTPSFHTLPKLRGKKEYWKCFGCDRWGDAHQLIINLRESQGWDLPSDYHGREALLFDLRKQYERWLYGDEPEAASGKSPSPSGHAQSQRRRKVGRPGAARARPGPRQDEHAGYQSGDPAEPPSGSPRSPRSPGAAEPLPSFFDFEQALYGGEYVHIPGVDYRREDLDATFRSLTDSDRAIILAAHAVLLDKGWGLPFEALASECLLVKHYAERMQREDADRRKYVRTWLLRDQAKRRGG
jgi:hypothetical protein